MQKSKFALILLAAAPFARADFTNGSFEDPAVDPGSVQIVGTGYAALSGWDADFSVIISNGYDGSGSGTTWHNTVAGNQYLYVNPSAGAESVSQIVSLAAGQMSLRYLQADYASDFATPGGAVSVLVTRVSDDAQVLVAETETLAYSDFIQKDLTFTAPTAGDYKFSFTGVSGHAANIDNVSVQAVPEPTTLAALGLGSLAVLRRRRKA